MRMAPRICQLSVCLLAAGQAHSRCSTNSSSRGEAAGRWRLGACPGPRFVFSCGVQGERPPDGFVCCRPGPVGWVTFFSPPPSPCRSSGSSSLQRLKAKLLESLCFYPPICSHLAGMGGGTGRALAVLWARRRPPRREPVLCPCSDSSGLWDNAHRGQAGGVGPAGRPVASLPTAPRGPRVTRAAPPSSGPHRQWCALSLPPLPQGEPRLACPPGH